VIWTIFRDTVPITLKQISDFQVGINMNCTKILSKVAVEPYFVSSDDHMKPFSERDQHRRVNRLQTCSTKERSTGLRTHHQCRASKQKAERD
jgi:hypothetical protein